MIYFQLRSKSLLWMSVYETKKYQFITDIRRFATIKTFSSQMRIK